MRTAFVLSLLHAATALPALPKDFSTKEHTMTGEDTTAIAARRYAAPAWAQTGLDNEACATFEGLVEYRKIVAARDKTDEIKKDVIKYDYQLLDDAYWLLETNGYKIVKHVKMK